MQTDSLELAHKERSKLLRDMDKLEKVLDELHVILQSLTPDVKVKAMSIELWKEYKKIETRIKNTAIEHDDILQKVTIIENKYGIKMSESY